MHCPTLLESIAEYKKPHRKIRAALKMLSTFNNIQFISIVFEIDGIPCIIWVNKEARVFVSLISSQYTLRPPQNQIFSLGMLDNFNKYFDTATFNYYRNDSWYEMNLEW